MLTWHFSNVEIVLYLPHFNFSRFFSVKFCFSNAFLSNFHFRCFFQSNFHFSLFFLSSVVMQNMSFSTINFDFNFFFFLLNFLLRLFFFLSNIIVTATPVSKVDISGIKIFRYLGDPVFAGVQILPEMVKNLNNLKLKADISGALPA